MIIGDNKYIITFSVCLDLLKNELVQNKQFCKKYFKTLKTVKKTENIHRF